MNRLWRRLTCGRGRHQRWRIHLGCFLDVDHRIQHEFIVARSCPRCGLVEVLE